MSDWSYFAPNFDAFGPVGLRVMWSVNGWFSIVTIQSHFNQVRFLTFKTHFCTKSHSCKWCGMWNCFETKSSISHCINSCAHPNTDCNGIGHLVHWWGARGSYHHGFHDFNVGDVHFAPKRSKQSALHRLLEIRWLLANIWHFIALCGLWPSGIVGTWVRWQKKWPIKWKI